MTKMAVTCEQSDGGRLGFLRKPESDQVNIIHLNSKQHEARWGPILIRVKDEGSHDPENTGTKPTFVGALYA